MAASTQQPKKCCRPILLWPWILSHAVCAVTACRVKCLLKFISCWLHALDIAAAFEELADACYEKLLRRRAQVRLAIMLPYCRLEVVHERRRAVMLRNGARTTIQQSMVVCFMGYFVCR